MTTKKIHHLCDLFPPYVPKTPNLFLPNCQCVRYLNHILFTLHYEKKLTKNIRPTDILQIYTSI